MTQQHYICFCELTGYPELISNSQHCELCTIIDHSKFTIENVNKAFAWYKQELEKLSNIIKFREFTDDQKETPSTIS